jgi:hypothetical protein
MQNQLKGEELVALWRDGGQESPAGPLFASGVFAEADITTTESCIGCGTQWTGSLTRYCC